MLAIYPSSRLTLMDPLTLTALASIVTIVMTGALTRVGEIGLDGTIAQFKRLIQSKSPETLLKLQGATDNPKTLPETIKVMATLIENDTEVKAVAEKVAQENQSKPSVINMMRNVGFVVQDGGKVEGVTLNFN